MDYDGTLKDSDIGAWFSDWCKLKWIRVCSCKGKNKENAYTLFAQILHLSDQVQNGILELFPLLGLL